jgi:hypothetical protein
MAGITLAQAEARLTAYLNAEEAVLNGQSYSIGSRSLTRADLKSIQQGIEIWSARVDRLTRGGLSVRGATPAW